MTNLRICSSYARNIGTQKRIAAKALPGCNLVQAATPRLQKEIQFQR